MTSDMTVATAADTSHAKSLVKFLGTLFRHEPGIRTVVYDLGLAPDERKAVVDLYGDRIILEDFPYGEHPAYFDVKVQAGEYAWKPVIVDAVASRFGGVVCWLDAGNDITGPLTRIEECAREHGVYASFTCGTLGQWTDHRTLEWMDVPPDMYKRRMRAACGLAFDTSRGDVRSLVRQWAECADVRECIAPEGSSKKGGHRQDQSVFTALLALYGLDTGPEMERWGWAAHRDNDPRHKSNIR